jgi:ubiquinone/menaquinone biosynthesis C-methylase UbiE
MARPDAFASARGQGGQAPFPDDAPASRGTKRFYEEIYAKDDLVPRLMRYPNEELCRFVARNFWSASPSHRKRVRVLDVGCGWGANLWMLAHEGFETWGIDLSRNALRHSVTRLTDFGLRARLAVADMGRMPFRDASFDVVVDVFSSNSFDDQGFSRFLDEVARVATPEALYFSVAPSKRSDAFLHHAPARKLDENTLDGIRRPDSAFADNDYPFRFTTADEYAAALCERGFATTYSETVSRTYRSGAEYFEFVVIGAARGPREPSLTA